MQRFVIHGAVRAIGDFHAWIATRNSRHKKTITIKDKKYVVGGDGPYVFIGMTASQYEFIGPEDLVPNLIAEIAATFSDITLTPVGKIVQKTAEKPKAKKPDQRAAQKDDEPKYKFLNHHEFVWHGSVQPDGEFKGHEWQIKDLGSHWIVKVLFNPSYGFTHGLYEEIGSFPGWVTLQQAEQMIFKAICYPVVSINPDPMFLRKCIDRWIDIKACLIWNHVYDTLRKTKPIREAEKRANELKVQFEGLYLEPKPKPKEVVPTHVKAAVVPPAPKPKPKPPRLRSGLRRDLKFDRQMQDMLLKFRQGGNLSDIELRKLLQFYGIVLTVADIFGQSHHLLRVDAEMQYARLIDLASDREWSQGLMSMVGVLVGGAFEKIC